MKFGLATSVIALTMSVEAAQVRILENGLEGCNPNCSPDFALIGHTVNYTVVGNTGTFEIIKTGFFNSNVTLANEDVHPSQVSTEPDAADGYDAYNFWSVGITDARYQVSFEIDISGLTTQVANDAALTAISSGEVDINATVLEIGSTNTLTDFTGAPLTGDLVTSSIDQIGFVDEGIVGGNTGTSFVIDFLGVLDSANSAISNIVAPSNPVYGVVTIKNLAGIGGAYDYGTNWWEQSFTGTVDVNVVVPVPASLILFGSSIAAMFGLRTKIKQK